MLSKIITVEIFSSHCEKSMSLETAVFNFDRYQYRYNQTIELLRVDCLKVESGTKETADCWKITFASSSVIYHPLVSTGTII